MTGHHKHHAINYIEFPCKDPQAIKGFYSRVFGWTFQGWGEDYISFSDGNLEGGFTRAERVDSGGARVILYSRDLEATLASVKAAGGTIHKEIFAFPGGRRFHFLDPDGNHLAVWSE
ncbi:VOC family protein [Edaphobacter albus]|uniref:VOC family protein n=1 Tax=Edaphobacter sp. 4G125 TaxID=2763071 RepID=UPI0016477586|nr:VOC family protein [Edaphobacter sp. 4G125]QNI38110.1 VOC family protein [Edaphobacter sp. 4G125]